MFAVGMETEWAELRRKALTAVFVSHASIAVPGLLGAGLAFLFYERLAQPGAPFIQFALFVSVSMSITAFPVLVRIYRIVAFSRHRWADWRPHVPLSVMRRPGGYSRSSSHSSKHRISLARRCVLGSSWFSAGVMFFVIKPWLPRWLGDEALAKAKPPKSLLAIVMAIVLASAFCTQLLGIHALFGAFVAGLIMPTEHDFRAKLGVRLENISTVLLLPVFFASSGLRTEIGLLHGRTDWLICLLIIALATFGKLGGTSVAAA
jgi:Kef-type K+ transport system membrane component KefB